MRPPARTRRRGSSARARRPRAARSATTRTGRARPRAPDGRRHRRSACSQEGRRLRELGLAPTLFCGGGWYTDADVAEACAELGYVDCTPRARRPAVSRGRRAVGRRSRALRGSISRRAARSGDPDDALARRPRSRAVPPAARCSTSSTSTSTTRISPSGRRRRLLATLLPAPGAGSRRPTDLDALAPRGRRHGAACRVERRGAALSFRRVQGRSAGRDVASRARAPSPTGGDVRASRVYVLSRGPILDGRAPGALRRLRSSSSTSPGSRSGSTSRSSCGSSSAATETSSGDCSGARARRSGSSSPRRSRCSSSRRPVSTGQRERRPGAGRILASLIVVALIVLAFGIGTGYDFTTSGLIPTAVVTSAIAIGLLRAAYESVSLELMRAAGIRRRVVLVGEGEQPLSPARVARRVARRARVRVRRRASLGRGGAGLRLLGSRAELPLVLDDVRPDEVILTEADFDERTVLEVVEQAHRPGDQGAPRARHDRAPRAARRVRARAGRAALRAPAAGADRLGLGGQADVRHRRRACSSPCCSLPLWLARRARDQARLARARSSSSTGGSASASASSGCSSSGRWSPTRAALAGRARGCERGRGRALQDPRRPARHARRPCAPPALARRDPADRERPQGRDEPRRPAAAPAPRLPLLEDWHRARYAVLPGMTGLWQISGRSGLTFDDLVRLDFTYLENWSIWLDITIIARTIPAVICRRGAY